MEDDQNTRQEELGDLENASRNGMDLNCVNHKVTFLKAASRL